MKESMITYSLKAFEKAYAFQITDQDPAVKSFLDNRSGSFSASNGWVIKLAKVPEVNVFSKTIYLRGSNSSGNFRIDRTWNLPNNTMRDRVISEVSTAISELISSVKRSTWKQPTYEVFPDEWDYIVYEAYFAPEAKPTWSGKFDSEGWGPNKLDPSKTIIYK
jgi:hypothetical protein